jgi:hypothetical protein
LDGLLERVALAASRLDRLDDDGGVAVAREHRRLRLADQRAPVGVEPGDRFPDAPLVSAGQPGRPLVDDHRRRFLAAGEALDLRERFDRLRAAGQERGRLVLLRLLELAALAREAGEDDERAEEDQPLGRPARGHGEKAHGKYCT